MFCPRLRLQRLSLYLIHSLNEALVHDTENCSLYLLLTSKISIITRFRKSFKNLLFILQKSTSYFSSLTSHTGMNHDYNFPDIYGSNHQKQPSKVFYKKGILKNYFSKFTGKRLCQSLFFNKVAGVN